MKFRNSHGFTVVEIIVAAAILLTVIVAASASWLLILRANSTSELRTQATLLTEEAAEAVQYFRDTSWSANLSQWVSQNQSLYLYWDPNLLKYATSSPQYLVNGKYYVLVTMSPLSRDITSNIVTSGGTIDSHSGYVNINISTASTSIMNTSLIIHDIFKN